jgi:iron complex outermembrane receptor protein
MRKSILFVAAFIMCISPILKAQQAATIGGTLTNSVSGAPVPNALVILEGPSYGQQVRSSGDGRFMFPNVPAGSYQLIIRADGYLTSRMDVTVPGGAENSDVQLMPELRFSEVTSVSPEGANQFESFQATNVLAGQLLSKEVMPTLGATLENQPGVAVRSFGPGPARPVVRGFDGDRVLIVEDGMRMGDLSSQSGDHGVNVNPASASRIEVVRGPATLLYGANAIGGLVNVITNEIPVQPIMQPAGSFTVDGATGALGGGAAGDVTVGNGRVALHVSGSGRRSDDYRSPEGDIPNSFNRAGFAEAGASYTADNGYLGASFAYDRSHYGIPFVEEGETNLDPRRKIATIRGEARNLNGFFNSVRGSFGVRRYRHDELDGEVVATSFINNTTELELLFGHRPMGRLKGSIGGSFLTRDYSTEGEESLSPPVDQKGFAGYVYEELDASAQLQFQFGARIEHNKFTPAEAEPETNFTNASGSFGMVVHPNDTVSFAFSFASSARSPALEELYNHGPHVGVNAFENGDATLDTERGLGFDASIRWRGTRASGEVTYFLNRVNNFIFRELTDEVEDDLPVTFYRQGDARIYGIESHMDVMLNSLVTVEGGLDYVRGDLTAIDKPLPRMPPLRGRLGLRLQRNAFQAGIDGTFTAKQDRIHTIETDGGTVGETATDGYNLLKLFASYSFGSNRMANTITVRLDNATDTLYHNHLNYLKDLAPEMGRSFNVVYGVRF